MKFTIDEPGPSDYVVVHGHIKGPAWVHCPAGNIWMVMGEAPNELHYDMHRPPRWVDRVYQTDCNRVGGPTRLATAFLPWWVDHDFDSLISIDPMPKSADLSWVTSDSTITTGHRRRMTYLQKVRTLSELKLYGRGFQPISGKWEGLAPFRYSVAFENFSNSHYFSEKVMDCFLAWTMPIYFGCTKLDQFFPAGSFVQLDPDAANPIEFLKDVIASNLRERNLPLIAEARRRVLYDFNLFNLIAEEIKEAELARPCRGLPCRSKLIWNHIAGRNQFLPQRMRGVGSRIWASFKPR